VASQPPADVARVPAALAFDWILLFVHPLADATSGPVLWAVVAAALLGLLALPFLPQPARAPVARVDPPNCNGCRRCFADCPYAAVTMVAHPLRRVGKELAVVDADLCAGCGICAGACPSSTPFRSGAALVTGIDMPQLPVNDLRERLRRGLAASPAERKIVAFGCERGARVEALAAADVVSLGLPCTGMLPPSFAEYALRDGAAGVLVSGCREGGCEFRFGQRWTADRLAGRREPHLRASVPAERLALAWVDAGDGAALQQALDALRCSLRGIAAPVGPAAEPGHG